LLLAMMWARSVAMNRRDSCTWAKWVLTDFSDDYLRKWRVIWVLARIERHIAAKIHFLKINSCKFDKWLRNNCVVTH
jgi:hypothetical protein